jgi:hypothetical protein
MVLAQNPSSHTGIGNHVEKIFRHKRPRRFRSGKSPALRAKLSFVLNRGTLNCLLGDAQSCRSVLDFDAISGEGSLECRAGIARTGNDSGPDDNRGHYVDGICCRPAMGIVGGSIYDAFIATCALKAKVDTLYTWNTTHFTRLGEEISGIVHTP